MTINYERACKKVRMENLLQSLMIFNVPSALRDRSISGMKNDLGPEDWPAR